MTKEAQELRAQSDEELLQLKQVKKAELFRIKNAFAAKDKEAKLRELRIGRKTIARALTILRERELDKAEKNGAISRGEQ